MDEQQNPYGNVPPQSPQQQTYGQQPYNGSVPLPRPETNLVWAILCTVLCCLPFGIVSIIYATKVDSCYMTGRYDEAVKNSKEARKWAIIGAITSAVLWVLYILVYVIIFGAIIANS